MRHAKSSWDNPGQSDHERPLNERGRRDAPRMGRLLEQRGLLPTLIVSSTATRARETAKAVAHAAGYSGQIVLEPRLYHATRGDWDAVLHGLPSDQQRVLCVGHNPGLEDLLRRWTGESIAMPTAAVAVCELPQLPWKEMDLNSATVEAVHRPKELEEEG
ncbi:MAG: histidine phosphatase family protein [Planctomyces sp.]|nr:histidine phosphatase family protein [Planctomyces sp.]